MSFNNGPVIMASVSMTTATLGSNDPELGTRRWVDGREYVFIYNDCNSNMAIGMGVVIASSATNYSATISSVTSTDIPLGVVRHGTISTGYYGWVVSKGFTYVKMMTASGTASAVGTMIELGGNGLFAPASNTTGNGPVIGKVMEVIASATTGLAYIRCF